MLLMISFTVQSYADKHAPPQFYQDDQAIGVLLTLSSPIVPPIEHCATYDMPSRMPSLGVHLGT